ncbi:MAG: ankyrin repeat domain-containing protein [Alphaproteobacteria bacterium]|nr:ankyrin repeat domain-containing protein [Alphaproteobacteria bacterium]
MNERLNIPHKYTAAGKGRILLRALQTRRRGCDKKLCLDLIAEGADINAKNDNGETPLHLAAIHGQQSLYIMMAWNPSLTVKCHTGHTPYDCAKANGHEQMAEDLRRAEVRQTFKAAADKGTLRPRKIIRPRHIQARPR